MELVIKGLIGAVIAISFALLGRYGKGTWAGLLALFPFFSVLGYWLVATSGDIKTLKETARASFLAFPVLLAFFASVYLLVDALDWRLAVLVGMGVWFIMALIWSRFIL